MELQFLGAAGTVTGSCYVLSDQSKKVMIDCGFFQGSKDLESLNSKPFTVDPRSIDFLLLTHAHLDHCGRLPKLVKDGFSGPIYLTEPTKRILEITLVDAARVYREHNQENSLFNEDDVAKTLSLCEVVEYDSEFGPSDFRINYRNAGHILGSAFIQLNLAGHKVTFSADLGNSPQELIEPTDDPDAASTIILESTYGDRMHEVQNTDGELSKHIAAIAKDGGTLMIPSFSIERTQELLFRLDRIDKAGKLDHSVSVFMDSPMAQKVTDVFRDFPDYYNQRLHQAASVDDPFSFPSLKVTRGSKDSRNIAKTPGPKIIIAGSGMMNGGRIVNHAKTFLPISSTRLLFVGFQAEGTLGRQLLEGQRRVTIDGEPVEVSAQIFDLAGLSSHADQPKLISWAKKTEAKNIILTHGEDYARKALAEKLLEGDASRKIQTPHYLEKIILPL